MKLAPHASTFQNSRTSSIAPETSWGFVFFMIGPSSSLRRCIHLRLRKRPEVAPVPCTSSPASLQHLVVDAPEVGRNRAPLEAPRELAIVPAHALEERALHEQALERPRQTRGVA